ncbi:DoxX family protein [Hazenella sp. IB182357]|uniref:DoxX family protein n=1 Tax=Polycladospora coralii TaxID=2771432 RepID=A0A926N8D0_9BACL|nr:DoxX family protein [Polycladospora coralii]MBD1373931.1 DoxX family protein [Polycladospora coralii]MBS7531997.1 DoxX family protein [Polycladospora coralii]
MAPLIVLLTTFIIFRTIGSLGIVYVNDWQTSLQLALACMFFLTASAHWGKRKKDLVRMVPPAIPYPNIVVTVTGVLEMIGAILLVIPPTTRVASICLALLLVVMFPANIRAAKHKLTLGGKATPSLWPRTMIQAIFLAAVILAGI